MGYAVLYSLPIKKRHKARRSLYDGLEGECITHHLGMATRISKMELYPIFALLVCRSDWQSDLPAFGTMHMPVMQIRHVMMPMLQAGVHVNMGMGLSECYAFNMLMDMVTVIVSVRMFVSDFVMDVVMCMVLVYQ
jgi:hypothetical protein